MKLLRNNFVIPASCRLKMENFTSSFTRKAMTGEEQDSSKILIYTGRPWKTDELRLKSNDDLHKLWYVLLKEKNNILSDSALYLKTALEEMPGNRIQKIQKSMSRLQFVLSERKNTREEYRKSLEMKYVEEMKLKLKNEKEKNDFENLISPQISFALLRSKLEALRLGDNSNNYIDNLVSSEEKKKQYKKELREKYSHFKQKSTESKPENDNEHSSNQGNANKILEFKNSIEKQLSEGISQISQEEILRTHIKNWRILDLKQRRVVLDMLNKRRSIDAKSSFIKELNLLAQKIAYEESKSKNN